MAVGKSSIIKSYALGRVSITDYNPLADQTNLSFFQFQFNITIIIIITIIVTMLPNGVRLSGLIGVILHPDIWHPPTHRPRGEGGEGVVGAIWWLCKVGPGKQNLSTLKFEGVFCPAMPASEDDVGSVTPKQSTKWTDNAFHPWVALLYAEAGGLYSHIIFVKKCSVHGKSHFKQVNLADCIQIVVNIRYYIYLCVR